MKIKIFLSYYFSSNYLLSTLRLSKTKIINILLVVIAFYNSGCVMTPPENSLTGLTYDEHQTHLKEVNENTARIYFYRKLGFFEGGRIYIRIDDAIVGKLDEGSYIVVNVEPKTTRITNQIFYYLSAHHSITKDLEGGKEYYIEVNSNKTYFIPAGDILGTPTAYVLSELAAQIYFLASDNVSTHHFIEKPKEDALIEMKSKMLYNKSYEYPELEI